jgi:hypothetical protein
LVSHFDVEIDTAEMRPDPGAEILQRDLLEVSSPPKRHPEIPIFGAN